MQPYENVKRYETKFLGFKEGKFRCVPCPFDDKELGLLEVEITSIEKDCIFLKIGGEKQQTFRVTKQSASVLAHQS